LCVINVDPFLILTFSSYEGVKIELSELKTKLAKHELELSLVKNRLTKERLAREELEVNNLAMKDELEIKKIEYEENLSRLRNEFNSRLVTEQLRLGGKVKDIKKVVEELRDKVDELRVTEQFVIDI
jgi:hypothetical protein